MRVQKIGWQGFTEGKDSRSACSSSGEADVADAMATPLALAEWRDVQDTRRQTSS